jgi:hypothetical protein
MGGQGVLLGQLLPAHAELFVGTRSKKIFDFLMVFNLAAVWSLAIKKRLLLSWVIKHLSPGEKVLSPRTMVYLT